jgi:hypothetical protein
VKKTLKEGWSNLHLNRIGGFLREARPVAMRIVGLNCQGLENDPKVSALLDIQRRYSPEVLFLSETHLDSYPVECLRRRSKMDFEIVNPTTTRSGVGVFLFWKREVKIEQIYSHPKYIDVHVVESPSKIWRFTGIYEKPRWEDKYMSWDRIREFKNNSNLPWIILGFFS